MIAARFSSGNSDFDGFCFGIAKLAYKSEAHRPTAGCANCFEPTRLLQIGKGKTEMGVSAEKLRNY